MRYKRFLLFLNRARIWGTHKGVSSSTNTTVVTGVNKTLAIKENFSIVKLLFVCSGMSVAVNIEIKLIFKKFEI